MLKWSKPHSNTPAIYCSGDANHACMTSSLLVMELGFLQQVMDSKSGSLSGQA